MIKEGRKYLEGLASFSRRTLGIGALLAIILALFWSLEPRIVSWARDEPTQTLTTTLAPTPASTNTPTPVIKTADGTLTKIDGVTITQPPTDRWRVDYYNGRNFDSYASTDYESELFISHNWANGSPGHGVGSDNFSIRYQRRVHFDPSCEWEFNVSADDGYRLYIDGNVIAERWSEGFTGTKATLPLTAGDHDVKLEYFEATGGARVSLSWQCKTPITVTPTVPPTATVWISPTLTQASVGRPVTVTIAISNVSDLGAFEFTFAYSPTLVTVQNITLGNFPGSSGRTFNLLGPTIDNDTGTATFGAYSLGASPPGPSGSGVLAYIQLLPRAVGTTTLHLSNVQVTDVPGDLIEVTTQDGTLRISACPGDFDGDGDVDIIDVQRIAYRWNTRCGDSLYDPIYDLDGDCDIDIIDVQRVASRLGAICQSAPTITKASLLTAAQPVTLTVQPRSQTVFVSQTFTVDIHISNAADLGAFEFTLAYSPTVLEVITATLGSFPGSTGRTIIPVGPIINTGTGTVTYGAYSLGSTPAGPTGSGPLAILSLRALAGGASSLDFIAAQVSDRMGNVQPVNYMSGQITVNIPPPQRTYRVSWLSHNTPSAMIANETKTGISVTIRNDSNWTWPYTGTNRVNLSYHWRDSSGKTIVWDGLRTALPHDLRPGQQVQLNAKVKAPANPGIYALVWDMVEEGITWFEWQGSPVLSLQVNVQPRIYRATWLSISMPVSMMLSETITNTNITLRNDSNWTWPYTGTNRVRLSYHWLDSSGKEVIWDGLRTALPHDLSPGQQVELNAKVKAPNTPGIYTLVWDIVEEGITWFQWRGSLPLSIRVNVQSRTYRATWLTINTPVTMMPAETVTNTLITVRNDGNWTWPYTGTNRVRLSYHWLDSSGKTILWDGLRTALPYDLKPGQQIELSARCKAPSTPGKYILIWDMVEDGVTWFEWQGNPTVSVDINVLSQPTTQEEAEPGTNLDRVR